MTEKDDKIDIADDNKENNETYNTAIDHIAGINNKANVLASQASFISKTFLGNSLNNSMVELSRQYSKMNSLYSGLPDISRMIHGSSALVAARDANLTIARLVSNNCIVDLSKAMEANNSIFSTHKVLASLSNPLSSFLKQENSIARIASFTAIDKSIATLFAASSSIGRIAEYSLQAEKNLAALNLATIGSIINIDIKTQSVISNTIASYSKSFSELWKSYETSPKTFVELSPILLRIPPIEYFNTSSFVENISVEGSDEAEEELLISDLLIENEETLTTLLPKLNPNLLNMWLGARQALESNNADKVRHFTTSIRELLTQILHALSPDTELIKWSNNPTEHIQNNKPTRRARLLYIYREVNNDHFKSFIEADIKATLQFIDLFQEGTHSVKSKLTDKQLLSIKLKAESTLKYLLQTFYELK